MKQIWEFMQISDFKNVFSELDNCYLLKESQLVYI